MSVVLQISDTHFGTEQPPVVAALQQLCATQAPDVLVLSGDITQRARNAQFRAAAEFVAALPVAFKLVVPGNHDIPLFDLARRLFAPYANYRRAFGDDMEPSFESDELLILCVNTTRPARHTDGEVSPEQIERVTKRLQAARPRQLRMVVTHQPVHVISRRDAGNLLHGYRDAVRAWSAAGVDLLLGGHIHLPYVRPLRDHFDALPRSAWAVQAGTAISWRVRGAAPNSVNIIRYDGDATRRCAVEQWDYNLDSTAFELALSTPLALEH